MKNLALLVLILSLSVVTVGSVISSSGYGLAIPDWPLSLGALIPKPLVAGIAWEFSHRVLSLLTGLATLLLGGLLVSGGDALQRRLGVALMALIVGQILLGGIGVLQEFPWLLKVMHASLALLFAGTAAAALAALDGSRPAADAVALDGGVPGRIRALASMIVLQLVAGAVVRHAETQGVMLSALVLHLVLAIGITVSGVTIALRIGPALRGWRSRIAYSIGAGVVVQVLLGFTVFVSAPEPGATGQTSASYVWHAGSHVVLGALLLAASTGLYVRLSRDGGGN